MILDETLKDGEMRIYKDLHNGWVEEKETINIKQTAIYNKILNDLKEYILTHKIYDEVKFKSELLKIIGGNEYEI